jgi:hypothetical protein
MRLAKENSLRSERVLPKGIAAATPNADAGPFDIIARALDGFAAHYFAAANPLKANSESH